jgi:hypothetical protein
VVGGRYAHFNRTFWKQVRAEQALGGFTAEVVELRRRVKLFSARCAAPDIHTATVAEAMGESGEGSKGEERKGWPNRLLPIERKLCSMQQWENVKFGCEIAKDKGLFPPERVCKACVYKCSKSSQQH